jgi:NAD(P)-dependent dehydrogenase (short-subunit alcohol dehydrogenase family)/acyl carrier protein
LIFGDTSALCADLTARLKSTGNHVVRLVAHEAGSESSAGVWPVNPSNANDVAQTVATALAAALLPCRHAVCLWGTSLPATDTIAAAYQQTISCCTHALHAAQALIRATLPAPPKLWLTTRGAQSAGATTPDVRSAPIWGLGRVLAVEHPEVFGGLIDLEAHGTSAADTEAIFFQISRPDGAEQCAFRRGVRFVPQLIPPSETAETALDWPVDGCHIITGGLGGVGLHIAHWMATQGARRLVLMSRRTIPPRAEWDRIAPHEAMFETVTRIREIEQLGAVVKAVAIDLADEAGLLQAMKSLTAENWLPVYGVIHAAAAIEDRLIPQLDRDAIQASFHAKVLGALHLESCLIDQPLQFFVYCSSVSSLLGQAGQANYAAANAFLDALVDRRRAEGRPALGINWGGWYGAGTAVSAGGRRTIQSLEQRGFLGFLPAQGVAALERLLRRNATHAVVMRVDWGTFRRAYPEGEEPPLLQRLAATAPVSALLAPAKTSRKEESKPRAREQLLTLAPGAARAEFVQQHLMELLASVLRLDAGAIDPTKTVGTLGLDSLMAVEFKNRCEHSFGLSLSATMVWNYPTIAALTKYLSDKLGLGTAPAPESQIAPAFVPAPATTDARAAAVLSDVTDLSEEAALQALLGTRGA